MRNLLLLCVALPCFASVLRARTWTDAAGRKVEAEFGGVTGDDQVKLKLPDGREVDYPMAKLSAVDQEFVRQQSAPAPEPVPSADLFPLLDFPVPSDPKRDINGRQVISWGPITASVPDDIDSKHFQRVFRPSLGAYQILKHMGLRESTLPSIQSPALISVLASNQFVAKEAELRQPAHSHLTSGGRLVASSTFFGISPGEVMDADDAGLVVEARIVRQSIRLHKEGWRPFLPGWVNAGIEEYARMLPWADGWPQTSHARVAMKKLQAELAAEKSLLISPPLIDVVLSQPNGTIGTAAGDRPQRIASLMAVFYLRHLHGDAQGTELKQAFDGVVAKVTEWQRYRRDAMRYEEVWADIKSDPRTVKEGEGRYRFSAEYEVPPTPKASFEAEEVQRACVALNDALRGLLGPQPGEAVISGMKKAGFTQGITLDKAEVASLYQKSAPGTPGSYVPRDLTPDYASVRPTNPLPPLAQRTWPLMVVMGANLSVPSLVKNNATSATYQLGSFQFETGADLSIPLVREIARSFAGMEELFQRLPWGIPPVPPESPGHFTAKLYPSASDYNKIAPPMSGGFYSLKEKVFHVPYQSLGMAKDAKGKWTRARAFNPDTLMHELTHMMMDRVLPALPIWVAEGSAEYVESIPLTDGALKLIELPKAIKSYVSDMERFQANIRGTRKYPASAKSMVDVLHITHKAWEESVRRGKLQKPAAPTPVVSQVKVEARPEPKADSTSDGKSRESKGFVEPMVVKFDPPRTSVVVREEFVSVEDRAVVQHSLYMHACLLFYYFMHLDNPSQRGVPMIPYLEKAREMSEKIQLFIKAEAAYEEEFKRYRAAWEDFAKLPGVTRTGSDSLSYPAHMAPPQPPTAPRPPIAIDQLPDKDITMSRLDLLIRGRTDDQLMKAFRDGFAKIGIALE